MPNVVELFKRNDRGKLVAPVGERPQITPEDAELRAAKSAVAALYIPKKSVLFASRVTGAGRAAVKRAADVTDKVAAVPVNCMNFRSASKYSYKATLIV